MVSASTQVTVLWAATFQQQKQNALLHSIKQILVQRVLGQCDYKDFIKPPQWDLGNQPTTAIVIADDKHSRTGTDRTCWWCTSGRRPRKICTF